MSLHLGFREVIIDFPSIIKWRSITVDTGAIQSTLQDINVHEYGGCFMYKCQSSSTQNRFIFWRVLHDLVEIWEESFDIDFTSNHIQLRFTETPVLEGLSIHETENHIVILLATVASIHRIKLPHPITLIDPNTSVFKDLNFTTLKDYHNHHVLSNNVTEALPHTASTHLISAGVGKGDAIFVLAQPGGTLIFITMSNMPYAVHFNSAKTSSFMNMIIGFVPTMFRGTEGSDTVTSLTMGRIGDETLVFCVSHDNRLRVWTPLKQECVLVYNILENTSEFGQKFMNRAQRHLIRSHSVGGVLYLAIYLCFVEKHMILVFMPSYHLGQISMKLVKTLYPPQYDLIDITVTSSYVWTLWRDSKNEIKVLYSSLNLNGSPLNSQVLKPAILESLPEREPALSDPLADPSEVYLHELLKPNRFSLRTLQKALTIYRRLIDLSSPDIKALSDEIEQAIREETDLHITDDMLEEDIAAVKLNAWAAFYSHTLEYHQVANKAISVISVGGGGLIAVLRNHSVTWLRPLDALELLMMTNVDESIMNLLVATPLLSGDVSKASGVVSIAEPLKAIRRSLYSEVIAAFELDLYHLEAPEQVTYSIATSLLSSSISGDMEIEDEEPLGITITTLMSGVNNVIPAIEAYLNSLELDLGNPDALTLKIDWGKEDGTSGISSFEGFLPWLSGAFCSRLGCGMISAVVFQFAQHRLHLCRDLLILQQILLQLNLFSSDSYGKMYSTTLSRSTRLTQAYFALTRLCLAPTTQPTSYNYETIRKQIAALGISDSNVPIIPQIDSFPNTALELFIMGSGGVNARELVRQNLLNVYKLGTSWSEILMPLSTTVAQLTWPVSKCLLIVEFLVWSNQHTAAQEYIRLVQPWCEWNNCSKKFLLAISLLNEGQSRKAYHLFLEALEKVKQEEFLDFCVLNEDITVKEAQIQYCLKVIRLMEQSGYISLALEMAKKGIKMASYDDPGLSALYAVSFKHNLEMSHHDEAFTALMACPDEQTRKNCLRQLIITLYERRCLGTLISYDYEILEGEVMTIIENRARSADILNNSYYDLLFAYHINKQNYKKGAWVMYECALRLSKEGTCEKALHHQAKCFLTCINCLKHIETDQAWIIRPVLRPPDVQNQMEVDSQKQTRPKNRLTQILKAKKKAQVEVLEIKDLEREFELIHARLKLFKIKQHTDRELPTGPMSAQDTVSLLTHGRFFQDALNICRIFDISATTVCESLVLACLEADNARNKEEHFKWLTQNGFSRDECTLSSWWQLLRQTLQNEEKDNQTLLHKTTCFVLLQKKCVIPAWIVESYKKRDIREFSWLYLSEGYTEESARLLTNYIDALLGQGVEQMGLESSLASATSQPVWFPYTVLDHLLLELKSAKDRPDCQKLHENVLEKLKTYQTELKKVSTDARFSTTVS